MRKKMKQLTELSKKEIVSYSGGGPISDWVACTVRSIIDKVKEDGAGNYKFTYCGSGNNVRC